MKSLALFALLVVCACVSAAKFKGKYIDDSEPHYTLVTSDEDLWRIFKERMHKSYASEAQETHRFKVFQQNLVKIRAHNAKTEKTFTSTTSNRRSPSPSLSFSSSRSIFLISALPDFSQVCFVVGLGPWTDITNEEYRRMLTARATNPQVHACLCSFFLKVFRALLLLLFLVFFTFVLTFWVTQGRTVVQHSHVGKLPNRWDWTEHNAVTEVKDQGTAGLKGCVNGFIHVCFLGQCGSCWSFSAVGTIEGAHAIAKKKLIGTTFLLPLPSVFVEPWYLFFRLCSLPPS